MKSFSLGLLSGVLAALITFSLVNGAFFGANNKAEGGALLSATPSTGNDVSLTALANENNALKKEIADLKKLTLRASDAQPQQAKNATTALGDPAPCLSVQAELNAVDQAIRNSGAGGFDEQINSSFAKEPVDAEWARDYEARLQKFVRNSPAFLSRTPQTIECRSSRCKLSIVLTDAGQVEGSSKEILESLEHNTYGLSTKAMVSASQDKGVLSFYFARNESVKLHE